MQTGQGAGGPSVVLRAEADHVQHCFDVLSAHFSGDTGRGPAYDEARCPLFVTWNKEYRRGDVRLRGCIGTLEPRPLRAVLGEYALTSALRDRRFPPIAKKELPALHCTVSLLSAFEVAADWQDWYIGLHGLIIEFADPITGAKRTATFLPEVAAQESWDHQQTIDALIRKSGFAGSVTAALRARLAITRYRSTTAALSYDEYSQRVARLPVQTGPSPSPAFITVPA